MNFIQRLFCPEELEDVGKIVADADDRLAAMLDIQKGQLEETKGLRFDLNQVLIRLANDPLPVTGERKRRGYP